MCSSELIQGVLSLEGSNLSMVVEVVARGIGRGLSCGGRRAVVGAEDCRVARSGAREGSGHVGGAAVPELLGEV